MTKRNITDTEAAYYKAREALAQKSPSELHIASPFLFSDRVAVQTLVSRYELYKMALEVPGDIVECGVYQGNSFLWMAHLSIILEPFAINRRLIGFDTFEGFASIDSENDPADVSSNNFSDTSFDTIQGALDALDIVRPVNRISRFELVKGDIIKTVPEYVENNPSFTCSMLILDTDLYLPTLTALKHIVPNMPKGGIVVFDEYNYQNFPGETKALKDFAPLGQFGLERFKHDSCMAFFKI